MENSNHKKNSVRPLVTFHSTDKGILATPDEALMTALGLPVNPTFYPAKRGEKAYLVGEVKRKEG